MDAIIAMVDAVSFCYFGAMELHSNRNAKIEVDPVCWAQAIDADDAHFD